MKSFRAFLLWAALAGAAIAQPYAAKDVNPAMASFADIYQMTVSAADPLGLRETAEHIAREPANEGPVRVSTSAPVAQDIQFRVTPAREPERWLLLLAGLALAGWVAHRRLVNWF